MGSQFKLIRGYPATPQIHMAIKKGELDGVCQSRASFKVQAQEMLANKEITLLVQISLYPDKEMNALGVPLLSEYLSKENLAKGVALEDVELYFKLTVIPPIMGRPFRDGTRNTESQGRGRQNSVRCNDERCGIFGRCKKAQARYRVCLGR